jgi:hypothetical protein
VVRVIGGIARLQCENCGLGIKLAIALPGNPVKA